MFNISFTKYLALSLLIAISGLSSLSYASDHRGYKKHSDKDRFKVRCKRVELIDAHLTMIPPIGPASGPANFVVGGRSTPAIATVELLGPPQPNGDGSANAFMVLQYDFGEGNVLNAFARAVLLDTGVPGAFTNIAAINYTGGTGIYNKAYGRFDGTGVLNFAEFTVDMAGSGEVCNLKRR